MPRHLPLLLAAPLVTCLLLSGFLTAQARLSDSLHGLLDGIHVELPLPAKPVPSNTVWLCKPGLRNNPCAGDLTSTIRFPDGSERRELADPAARPSIDCFYVYPTVSLQSGVNSNLDVERQEQDVAQAEASRFSQECNVYAPMYRQLTRSAINNPGQISMKGAMTAYEDVWRAFLDYMAHYNHGRGIVFIGHSQGAFMLRLLLQSEVDSEPSVRRQLVSALLLGGNVTVRQGSTTGGDFARIPACQSESEVGCVVSYSTYMSTPAEDALFGRVDSPINPFHPDSAGQLAVLCVNPASPSGGRGYLSPYMPTSDVSALTGVEATPATTADTPFVAYPGEYSAECITNGVYTWLQVDRTAGAGDRRPGLARYETPRWGLHMVDVSVALGNLVEMVGAESLAYTQRG